MLELTRERAGVEDGMHVLDLGCGWGSFALWLAARQPNSAHRLRLQLRQPEEVHRRARGARAGSETSRSSRRTSTGSSCTCASIAWSRSRCSSTCATTSCCSGASARWLAPHGRLFVHIFCHRRRGYLYEAMAQATGWPASSSAAAPCRRPICSRNSRTTSRSRRAGGSADPTTRAQPKPGCRTSTRDAARWRRCSPRSTAALGGAVRSRDGGCSSSPARRCSGTPVEPNGASRTIASFAR